MYTSTKKKEEVNLSDKKSSSKQVEERHLSIIFKWYQCAILKLLRYSYDDKTLKGDILFVKTF